MRARGALLALPFLLVALSGCLSDDGLSDLPGTEEGDVPFVSHNTLVDSDSRMGEPSLGVHPDGDLFTYTRAGVFRSSDDGQTWTALGNPMTLPNFDPDLTVDPDGVVWYDTLWLGCTETAVSKDKGETWHTNPAACGAPVSDRQYVIATGDCTAYEYAHQLPTFHQTFAKTTDCGATWVPMGSSELATNGPGAMARAPQTSGWGGGGFFNPVTGSVFFTWTWNPAVGDAWSPGFSVTRDGGLTWDQGSAATTDGGKLGLSLVVGAADDAGNVYMAWGEQHEDDVGIYLAASKNDGVDWSDPIRMDVPGAAKVFPAITAGGHGEVAVAYYEASEGGTPFGQEDDATWNVTLAWTHDAFADTPAIARGNLSERSVKNGSICPNGTTCEGDREFLDYFALKRLPDGRLGTVFNSQGHNEDPDDEATRNVYAATTEALFAPWADHTAHASRSLAGAIE